MGNDKQVVDAPDVVRFTLTVRRWENPELYWWLKNQPNRKASERVRKILGYALQQAKAVGAIEHPTAIMAAQRPDEMANTQEGVMTNRSFAPAPETPPPMVPVAQPSPAVTTVLPAPIPEPPPAAVQPRPAAAEIESSRPDRRQPS